MIKVKVPASSANMGAGFDTLGVALNLYSRLEIEETDGGLEIITKNHPNMAADDKSNLVYRSMQRVFDEVGFHPKGLKIVQDSKIPMTRGLGSSSACIIGGMLGANALSGRTLSYRDIIKLAADMEGHPDNVTPALFGGFCVSAYDGGEVLYKSIKLKNDLTFAAMSPDYFVATKKSRGVLPDEVPLRDAAHNIARASLLQAGLATGDYELLRAGVDDRIHQPFRKSSVDGFDEIFDMTYRSGALATYLSGSGPTIMSIVRGSGKSFKKDMERFFRNNSHGWTCMLLECDNVGAVVSRRLDD